MNVKKIISLIFSSIITVNMISAVMGTNASGKPVLSLKVNGLSNYIASAGEKVELTYEISGGSTWSTSGIHFNYDTRLTPDGDDEGNIYFGTGQAVSEIEVVRVFHRSGVEINNNIPSAESEVPDISSYVSENQNCVFVVTSSTENTGQDGIVISIKFTVPEDAEEGEKYNFNFWTLESDLFTDCETDTDMQNYAFANFENCYIEVKNKLSPTLLGDANDDGVVDIADVVSISAYVGSPEINALSEQGLANADVQNVGNGVNANDALAVQQYLANILESLE